MSRDQILCYFKSGIQKRYCKSSGVISLRNLLKLERYPSPRHFPPILEKTVLIGTNKGCLFWKRGLLGLCRAQPSPLYNSPDLLMEETTGLGDK